MNNTKQDFSQKYDAKKAEIDCQKKWGESDTYVWSPKRPASTDYVIDTPPPTVSGTLHIGHVYSYTQADIIARYFRMSGKNVLYPIGWDDNGLPTERLVEKVKKIRGGNMSRKEFVDICNEVIPKYEQDFRGLFSRLGLSVDWSREYQTISETSRAISQMSFLDLYHKGLVERRLEPSLWDPADRTAIAQAEVEEMEREGVLNYLEFKVEGNEAPIEIATTRPELLAGCGAIMIHSSHPRASSLVGKRAITPLFNVAVPFIIDEKVDPEKGTGMVMCCTFGDITDIEWYKAHSLPLRIVIDGAGKIRSDIKFGTGEWSSETPEEGQNTINELAGLKVAAARDIIIEKLGTIGVLKKQDKTIQIIPIAERSGAPLEIIVTPQWFIKTLDFKDEILRLGREINWQPSHMFNRFSTWVEGLKWDWCISRQRHFGVPIPAWTSKRLGEEGKILLPHAEQLPVDPLTDLPDGYERDEVDAITDVMDTWATSSVTPNLISRSVSDEFGYEDTLFQRITPAQMRPQAHEIIRTWAFYTIVKSMHHHGSVPWKNICISGWCLAKDGSKMSKSKGNIIDPIKMIDDNGVDAVRYWTSTSRLGNDTALDPNTLKQGRRLVTKLWNAARLVESSLVGYQRDKTPAKVFNYSEFTDLHIIDQWMLSELFRSVSAATDSFKAYEYAQALSRIERFFWGTFCDNYLELVKWRIHSSEKELNCARESAQISLDFAMREILRMFAPFIPYITEVLFQNMYSLDSENSVHEMGNWPSLHSSFANEDNNIDVVMPELMMAIRKLKSTMEVSVKQNIGIVKLSVKNISDESLFVDKLISEVEHDICNTLHVDGLLIEQSRDRNIISLAETDKLYAWV